MALEFPKWPTDVSNGDERTYSPHKSTDSLLAAERGTDSTRRLETDANRNLYVNLAASGVLPPSSVAALAVGGITSIPASTQVTIVTFTAATDVKLSKISVSGTDYAKFQLYKNMGLIETKRSSPERSLDFEFAIPLNLVSGDIIDVKVTHYATGVLADFESTVYGG
jgi:hypothetical protein